MQMYRLVYILSLLLLPSAVLSEEKHDLDAVLKRLDAVMDSSHQYVAAKNKKIASLITLRDNSKTALTRYEANMLLYEEYRSYKNDSAVSALTDNIRLAKNMKRKDLEGEALSLLAFQCSSTTHYTEAQVLLSHVDESQLKGRGLFYYYRAQNHLYSETAYYSPIKQIRDSAYVISHHYETLLLQSLDKRSADYKEYLCRRLFSEGKLRDALRVCDEWNAMTPDSMRNFAMVAFYQYLIHTSLHEDNTAIWWAARSSICDITHAVMDQGSLWPVADYVSNTDIDKSNKYINFAWQCAMDFGPGIRTMQISPVLSTISSQYQSQLDNANRKLKVITAVIALLALGLLFMLYYSIRQRSRLAQARNDLHKRNLELTDSNGKLKEANDKVTAINGQLHEADHIKEVYIGRFLTLCADYIERMDKARRNANKLIKAHKIDDLYQLTRSTEQKEKDVEELYGYFDSTFLNIFPNFIEDFNALLRPDCRFETQPGQLNPTLRIFALIRLGIDDSRTIAAFLHYSVHTIYNYRNQTRHNSIGDSNDFEDKVKKLGKI